MLPLEGRFGYFAGSYLVLDKGYLIYKIAGGAMYRDAKKYPVNNKIEILSRNP